MATKPIQLRARFELDPEGKPVFVADGEVKHYAIHLFVKDVPEDAESVQYRLHETYFAPVREVFRRPDGKSFEEVITSYGDFVVRTTVSGAMSAGATGSAQLSAALEEYYRESSAKEPEPVRAAIEDIRRH